MDALILKQLEELALATLLRRLSDRIVQETALIYKLENIDFESRWFTVYYILTKSECLSILDISNLVGLTHSAVSQIVTEMASKGIVSSLKDKKDSRKKMVKLTKKGKNLLPKLGPIWDKIKFSIREAIDDTDHDITCCINNIEHALDKKTLFERVQDKIGPVEEDENKETDFQALAKKLAKRSPRSSASRRKAS